MKVGVVGSCGVVGSRVASWLESSGHRVERSDVRLFVQGDVASCELVFLCVPTPLVLDRSSIGQRAHTLDDAALVDACGMLGSGQTVVVRSTVVPGTTRLLAEADPDNHYVHMPEFLTEATAESDFLEPVVHVAGCVRPGDEVLARAAISLMPPAPVERVVGAEEAELMKLASNAFYAVKVSFANQLFDLTSRSGTDYEAVRGLLELLPMVGPRHLDVHHGGYRGFGGKCLPKDSSALVGCGDRSGADLSVLREAVRYNERLRK